MLLGVAYEPFSRSRCAVGFFRFWERALKAFPVGTIREMKRSRAIRNFVKVSHHGGTWRRWRPNAVIVWERHHERPVPDGHRIEHRDGDRLNDDIENLMLVRGWRLGQHHDSGYASRFREGSRKAVAKTNRMRSVASAAQLNPAAWYIVLPCSKAFVMVPCRSRKEAQRLMTPADLTALCAANAMLVLHRHDESRNVELFNAAGPPPINRVEYVRGADIAAGQGGDGDGEYEGYIRLIPDVRKPPRSRSMWVDLELAASTG